MTVHVQGPVHTAAQDVCTGCGDLWPCQGAGLDAARLLVSVLGVAAVSALAGARESTAAEHWLRSGRVPENTVDRLLAAEWAWDTLIEDVDPDTARSWFVGANPLLDGQAPLVVIREGRGWLAADAALDFVTGTWAA